MQTKQRAARPRLKWVLLSLLAAAVVMLICAFYSGLTVRRYAVQTDALATGDTLRIVLLADLHSTIYGSDQQPLIDAIVREEPDLILLAGDIADDRVPIDGTLLLLDGLRDAAPMYYVAGNHEYWGSEIAAIRAQIRAYGVTILSDEYHCVQVGGVPVVLAGLEDPDKRFYEDADYDHIASMQAGFAGMAQERGVKILIAHRPENIDAYKLYPFDLVVSGHAHGGQVRIPFLVNGLYAPNQGWFPPYAGGRYDHGPLVHIISRGLVVNPRLPRVFNPPELVVITLTGGDKE